MATQFAKRAFVRQTVEAIFQAPAPTNVAGLRSFLGLVNYYGKFLPDLATLLSPLYLLLQKKQKWMWCSAQEEAFRKVKELLKSSRVLVHFDSTLPLTLSCDASPYGVGAVLSHKMPEGERPIAFASRTLTTTERAYSQLDKEALAIVYGVKKYHQYLYGRSFQLKTDHKPLIYIFSEKKATPAMASSRIQRWSLTLGAYSYTIEHRKGSENENADALSRLPLSITRTEPAEASRCSILNGISRLVPHHQLANSEIDRSRPHPLQSERVHSNWMAERPSQC